MNKHFNLFLALVSSTLLLTSVASAQRIADLDHGRSTSDDVLRLGVQGVAGAATATAVWLPTRALVVSEQEHCIESATKQDGLLGTLGCVGSGWGAAFGGLSLATLLVPTSIYVSGELAGGNGNYWYTMLGGVSGSGVGMLSAILVAGNTDGELSDGAAIALLSGPMVIGSMIAYELSQSAEDEEERAARDKKGVTLSPTASVTEDGQGGLVALSGRF